MKDSAGMLLWLGMFEDDYFILDEANDVSYELFADSEFPCGYFVLSC